MPADSSLRGEFTGLIRNELPHKTFLELAAWYSGAGLEEDAARVLELAPPTGEVLYWLAYLRRDAALLSRAEAASPAFVFPFRNEMVPVFEWARQRSRAWPAAYYLALVLWHRGETDRARELMAACGGEPGFAPFYAARARLGGKDAARDLRRAAELEPGQWRYGVLIVQHELQRQDHAAALAAAEDYARRFPENIVLGLLRARC